MYSLFQLVRLFTVRDEEHSPNVKIRRHTWRQHGESNLLALVCSNGFIVLWYSTSGKSPVVKQLPWPPDHPIIGLCFDPTVAWLLVLTDNGNLFIIPALAILDPVAQVNQIWRLDDVSIITTVKPRGAPKCVLWWNTLDGQQIAIIASKLGEIIFVNLVNEKVVAESSVDADIKNIEIVTDDQQITTQLLITGTSGIQWKLLLETRQMSILPPDTELSDLGYEKIDGLTLPLTSITESNPEKMNETFMPLRFYQFPRSVSLSPQYAKGRHFVTAHCDKTSTYQVYDSNIEHNPLFVYKLPFGSLKIIFTDRVMFVASKMSGEQRLMILSNQRAESSDTDQKDFNKDAVLQQINLPEDEMLLTCWKKSFPFYWHEKIETERMKKVSSVREDSDQMESGQSKVLSALEIQLNSHTVLDGCIVVTDTTVYECRPRVSPERLFLDLCISQSDVVLAEQLGISLSLDLNSLFGVAADFLLAHGNSTQAARLFHISKTPALQRVSSFAKYGFIREVMPYLQQILSKENSEVSADERQQLADMALHGFILQIKQGRTTDMTGLVDTFRQYLCNSFHFCEQMALELLAKAEMEDILFEFAMARGLVIDALSALVNEGSYQISASTLDQLVDKGFSAHVAQAAGGAFLQCLSANSLVKIFCAKPLLVSKYTHLLLSNLNDLDIGPLLSLAESLDPSKPQNYGFLVRKFHSRLRTSSSTGMSLYGGEMTDSTASIDKEASDATALLYCFLMTVLVLNKKRRNSGQPVCLQYLYRNPVEFLQTMADNSPSCKQKLTESTTLVGCGQCHAAVVMRDDLYTWGKASLGRLGTGEDKPGETISMPRRVETFSTLQIKVTSVACGGEHTVVLTQQGVYGWGSSKLGQVGLNTRHVYSHPMQVEALAKVTCVAVTCGQYHTMVLDEDSQVYSWGWGIHGQLGHGDPEDQLLPTLVSSLSDKNICLVSGGFCHSLAQTKQGELYVFGCGFFGQLGLGTTQKHTLPVKVDKLPEKIRTCGTKFFHSVVVTRSNRVYQWGGHPHGLRYQIHAQRRSSRQSGGGQSFSEQVDKHLVPQQVDTSYVNGKITKVVCGSFHTCLVTADGDVYSWGRNLDGQIGNGSKQDVRIPQMVITINHRNIGHMTSGGEFNVALDTGNHVWVWGRNEFGQLGLQSLGSSGSSKITRGVVTKNSSSQLTEVATPTTLDLEVSSPQGLGSTMIDSFTRSSSLESINTALPDDDQLAYLPNLGTVDEDIVYGPTIIPIVIQSLPKLCHCQQLLRKCTELEDWSTAACINIHLTNYTEALSFHLKALRKGTEDGEKDRCSDEAIEAFQYYYRLLLEKKTSASRQEEAIKGMLIQLLRYWEREHLSVSRLEACLTDKLDLTATLLSLLLFRNVDTNCDKDNTSTETLMEISPEFQRSFSTKFCLLVTSVTLKQIHKPDWMDQNSLSELKHLGGDVLKGFPMAMFSGDKLPDDQLWQDIVQNLTKGMSSKKYIYITHSELDRFADHYQQTDMSSASIMDHGSAAMFFTCGHYFNKTAFSKELSVLQRELMMDKLKLPETAAAFQKLYSRKTTLPMACPRCISTGLPTIS